jgi:dGTPase
MAAMDWARLLSRKRLRRKPVKPSGLEICPFEEDQDRICFSQPFRRLQAKTQVHPLAENDHVRTRLIHSVEVGCIGQVLGSLVGAELSKRTDFPATQADFASLVKAACLAHDIGHPPFGHAGEEAVRAWTSKRISLDNRFASALTSAQAEDLRQYEGNAQGFRILTKLENHRDDGGLQLSYATLGAGMKYPWGVDAERNKKRKFGFFQSEKNYAEDVANELGLLPVRGGGWCRHPLAYLVEAADDICYALIDLEDGVEMDSFGFKEFEELLSPMLEVQPGHSEEYTQVAKFEFQKMSYLRSKAIFNLTLECVEEFLAHEGELLSGAYEGSLVDAVPHAELIKTAKEIGRTRIYHHPRKQYAEIAAFQIVDGLLEEFTNAFLDVQANGDKASFKSLRMHRMMGDRHHNTALPPYAGLMGLCDFVTGMTDRFATGCYRQVKGVALGGMTPTP